MVSLAGLSAAYPGYQQAESTDLQNRLRQAQASGAETQIAGQQAFGNTLRMFQQAIPGAQPMQGAQGAPPMQGGQPPQPPMPGQPSVPTGAPQQGPAPVPPGAGPSFRDPSSQAPPGAGQSPMGGGRQGAMDWRQIAQAVTKANPGAKPEVIAAAVSQFLPLMNAQAQQEWKQVQLQLQQARVETSRDVLDTRREQFQQREERFKEQSERKEKAFQQREQRLAARQQVLKDQGYQKLEIQKENLKRQVEQGDRKTALAQWRAVVDAQHKRAMEVIGSQAAMLPAAERKKLLDEQNEAYKSEIEAMRGIAGSTTPTGGKAPAGGGKTSERIPPNQPIVKPQQGGTALPPEAAQSLKEGHVTTFSNGQKWTLKNGQPEQVQ